MSKEREALKLALEALENTSPLGFNMEADKHFYAAITAIKEALANHIEDNLAMVAQPEQEPVRLQCVKCGTVYAEGVPPQVPKQEPVAFGIRGGLAHGIKE